MGNRTGRRNGRKKVRKESRSRKEQRKERRILGVEMERKQRQVGGMKEAGDNARKGKEA